MKNIIKRLTAIIITYKDVSIAVAAAAALLIVGAATTERISNPGNTSDVASYSDEQVAISDIDFEEFSQEESDDEKENTIDFESNSLLQNIEIAKNNELKSDIKLDFARNDNDKTVDSADDGSDNSSDNSSGDSSDNSFDNSSGDNSDNSSDNSSDAPSDNTETGNENGGIASDSGSSNDSNKYSSCYVTITCAPFLDDCSAAIKAKLPSGGGILSATEVEFKEGDSAWDVLKRVCDTKGIQYTATNSYYGIYISSVDNLSEKYYDNSTGWMYYVNGSDPGVAASSFSVTKGCNIVWMYDAWSF